VLKSTDNWLLDDDKSEERKHEEHEEEKKDKSDSESKNDMKSDQEIQEEKDQILMECVKYLVEIGADIHCINGEGQTPLYFSSIASTSHFLVENGCEVNIQDQVLFFDFL